MTGAQVREARRLLGWSADRLGAKCDVAGGVISAFERTGRMKPRVSWQQGEPQFADRVGAIRTALEAAGVVFTNSDETGVKLRKTAE